MKARLVAGVRVPAPPSSGQAAVELVALLPLLVAVVAAVTAVFAAGAAGESARAAAHAAAVAMLQERDPRQAAEAALGERRGRLAAVRVRGDRVTVTVRPRFPIPAVSKLLKTTATVATGVVPGPAAPRARTPAPTASALSVTSPERGGDGRSARPRGGR
jgi:hypothetical protein